MRYFLIFIFFPCLTFSQDIHILGNMKNSDAVKIMNFIVESNKIVKPKKFNIFYNSKPIYAYHRRKSKDYFELNGIIRSAAQINNKSANFDQENFENYKNLLLIGDGKQEILSYNTSQVSSSNGVFNNLDAVISYLKQKRNHRKKYIIMAVFMADKPVVQISNPTSGKVITSGRIEGKFSGVEAVIQVKIRMNGAEWQEAKLNHNKWYFDILPEVSLNNTSGNRIEAIAINAMNDTSDISTVTGLQYRFITPSINYIYPNVNGNMVQKCQQNSTLGYHFKIEMNYPIPLEYLAVLIEDNEGDTIYNINLDRIGGGDLSPENIFDNQYQLCFYLPCSVLKKPTCCMIDLDEDYFFQIKNKSGLSMNIEKKIKVHFSSIDYTENAYNPCNCN